MRLLVVLLVWLLRVTFVSRLLKRVSGRDLPASPRLKRPGRSESRQRRSAPTSTFLPKSVPMRACPLDVPRMRRQPPTLPSTAAAEDHPRHGRLQRVPHPDDPLGVYSLKLVGRLLGVETARQRRRQRKPPPACVQSSLAAARPRGGLGAGVIPARAKQVASRRCGTKPREPVDPGAPAELRSTMSPVGSVTVRFILPRALPVPPPP